MDGAAPERVVMTKDEARLKGLKRYFTGTPCKRGHFSERDIPLGECLACRKAQRTRHIGRSAVAGNIIEPQMWPCDDHTRREPVIDPLDGRLIRFVGWRACMCCKRPFFSADVKRVRICNLCKSTRDNPSKDLHLNRSF